MRSDRRSFLVALAGFAIDTTPTLPPLSWTCSMHPEVVDNKSGLCPICRMALVRVRLALVWTCPVHREISASTEGRCRSCRRDLIRVIKAQSWTCPVHQKVDDVDPGRCHLCRRALVAKYSERPHGDHNPKHGGFFFMAPNNWHIEGTHPAADVFRLYVYDEYSKPFIPAGFSGRLILPSTMRPERRAETSVPFRRSASGQYLEARGQPLGIPATVVIAAKFHAQEPEYRFDFAFLDYSKEPSAPATPGRKD